MISRSSFRSVERVFMRMAVRFARRLRTLWLAANCMKIRTSIPGLVNGKEGDGLPFPVTLQVLARGQERFNVYCSPCHSRVGNGEGMIVQRGYAPAGNYHTPRLEAAPLGHFFNVMTNGYGAMPDYAAQLTPADRWAVVAYIKALQLSQKATRADVPSGAQVETLTDIAKSEGLDPAAAEEWVMPPTAVRGTPDDQTFVLPAQSSGATAAPAKAAPAATSAPTGQAAPQ